jgi:DNA-binding NarL/FixJ family response regulator
MVPLMGRGSIAVGGFCVAFHQRHTPTEDEFRTLELYARMAAHSIEMHAQQARLQMQLREATEAVDKYLAFVSRTPVLRDLSRRELDVLTGIAAGEPDKQIAFGLGISVFTVHKHVRKILEKMDVSSRTEAGIRAVRLGLGY